MKLNLSNSQEFRPMAAVELDQVGARLDGFLAQHHPFYSRAGWQKKIRKADLLVNGLQVRPSTKLRQGDRIEMRHVQSEEPEVDRGIRVLWEESGVMAVYKPGHLPMHANGPYLKNTFAWILRERFGPEWSAVHRLDMETSGIVLCAATSGLRGQMSAIWQAQNVRKTYLAIVNGCPAQPQFVVNQPIKDLEESKIRIKKWVHPDGLDAETAFTVVERKARHSLLSARPITGRTNQIRIHAAWCGHVLVGDKLFHPNEAVFLDYFENGDSPRVHRQTGFSRVCLHAAEIEFPHPLTGENQHIRTPLPIDLQEFWASLG